MEKKYSQCQSCGMPLKDGLNARNEASSEKSLKYCNLCYKDGNFCNPDIKLDEMKQIVDKALIDRGWWKPLRWIALMQLPTLERWRHAS